MKLQSYTTQQENHYHAEFCFEAHQDFCRKSKKPLSIIKKANYRILNAPCSYCGKKL